MSQTNNVDTGEPKKVLEDLQAHERHGLRIDDEAGNQLDLNAEGQIETKPQDSMWS